MKSKIKTIINTYKAKKYNDYHKKEAMFALSTIEKNTGYELTKELKGKIDEYAKSVLGSVEYAPWLYVYTAYNEEFKEGWIPDNYFGWVVAPKVNKDLGKLSNIKTLSKKIIQTDLLPDSYYMIDRTLYDLNYNIIEREQVMEKLFENEEVYFFKKNESNQGRGVIKITRDNFNIDKFYNSGDAVIQSEIVQHDWFNKIISGSVATIRITTIKEKNGKSKFAASYLRLGRKSTNIVTAKEGIRVPIFNIKGELGEYASDSGWKKHYKHPDTNFRFLGEKIPFFEQAVNRVVELHQQIPHVSIIGWDVSITNTGEVKIIEWNAGHPDVKFTECAVGPSFKGLGWENLHKE